MNISAIDSVLLAVADMDAAGRPYERLGLRLSSHHDRSRTLHVGPFAVRFLADGPLAEPLRDALSAGRSLFAVGLRVAHLDEAVLHLASKGISVRPYDPDVAWASLHEQAGTDIVLLKGTSVAPEAADHTFPLRRLDHLAAVTHDLEAKTRFWTDVLGIPVAGEVTTPTMVIRQLRIGDAVLELLGAASADSPIHKRPPGLVSMASWEVADLEAAVAQARGAGFTVTDPATGVLPGTRIATIQGSELAGVNMQLLQYIGEAILGG